MGDKYIKGTSTGATGSGGEYYRGDDEHFYVKFPNGKVERSIYDNKPDPEPATNSTSNNNGSFNSSFGIVRVLTPPSFLGIFAVLQVRGIRLRSYKDNICGLPGVLHSKRERRKWYCYRRVRVCCRRGPLYDDNQ